MQEDDIIQAQRVISENKLLFLNTDLCILHNKAVSFILVSLTEL